jgi:hypothetical protein
VKGISQEPSKLLFQVRVLAGGPKCQDQGVKMELVLANDLQHKIADLLWVADSQQEVDRILKYFGHDARVVYELMTAAAFDNPDHCDQAEQVIHNIKQKYSK